MPANGSSNKSAPAIRRCKSSNPHPERSQKFNFSRAGDDLSSIALAKEEVTSLKTYYRRVRLEVRLKNLTARPSSPSPRLNGERAGVRGYRLTFRGASSIHELPKTCLIP